MSPQAFHTQWQRLIVRFGVKSMDDELKLLVTREVHDMGETAFQRFVDVLIGSRTAHKPPLLSEFREARLAEQKLRFQNETQAAARAFTQHAPEELRANMRKVLSKEFGKVESVADALQIARLRLRTGGGDNG